MDLGDPTNVEVLEVSALGVEERRVNVLVDLERPPQNCAIGERNGEAAQAPAGYPAGRQPRGESSSPRMTRSEAACQNYHH
jgi:hypothetical protein